MSPATLKKHVKTYKQLIIDDVEEAKKSMEIDGLTEDEINEILEEVNGGEAPKTPKKEVESSKNYSIHKCEPIKKDGKWVLDEEGNYTYEKKDHVRDVNITDYQAEVLNSQSFNSKVRYYKK